MRKKEKEERVELKNLEHGKNLKSKSEVFTPV